jgi:DeoR/GlpR family transcriptional regulator of sugar metabolism
MSQIGNALRMLVLLKGNGMMKIKELAQIIGVKERTIRRYRDDLEQARI